MSIWQGLLGKLGLADASRDRGAIRVFLLDDDETRHDWFAERFNGDQLDIAVEPRRAIELLSNYFYDAIFLDHDLLPEHYKSSAHDDERTGYAVAAWLAARPEAQPGARVVIHSLNYAGAERMLAALVAAGFDAECIPFHYLQNELRF